MWSKVTLGWITALGLLCLVVGANAVAAQGESSVPVSVQIIGAGTVTPTTTPDQTMTPTTSPTPAATSTPGGSSGGGSNTVTNLPTTGDGSQGSAALMIPLLLIAAGGGLLATSWRVRRLR